MMREKLKCSLIVSAYNQAPQLDLLLESVRWQTEKNFEVVIADDGSSDNLPDIIARFMEQEPGIPVAHVWHEDAGFRKTIILNKAVKVSRADYLVFVDGDMILDPRFIEMHVRYARPGRVMCGWRGVKIREPYARQLIEKKARFNPSLMNVFWQAVKGNLSRPFRATIIHNRVLRKYLAKERGRLGGCNFALYKSDYEKANGMDESILQYGYEDYELGHRLQLNGIMPVGIRNCANTFHLEHPKSPGLDISEIKSRIRASTFPRCRFGLVELDDGSSNDMFVKDASN